MTNPKHMAKTSEWGTPPEIIELARTVLGEFDLDPASSAEWNKVVRAKKFYNQESNGGLGGLGSPWEQGARVFLNPPGDMRGKLARAFNYHASQHARLSGVSVFYVGFSIEQLRFAKGWPIAVPPKRIQFIRPDGTRGKNPTHSSFVQIMSRDKGVVAKFRDATRSMGWGYWA